MEDKMLFETDVCRLPASGRLIEDRLGHVPCLVWDFEELVNLDADVDEAAECGP